ncbi:MAG: FAD-dependent oxidoreductase [Akkermansiaceae bacterium]|nr:FAD-dependent oxidoreductase [Akkermansiaceae bacterium]
MNPPFTIRDGKAAGSPPSHEVIISGAGPVGLFLACELALAKCSVLILEKAENPHSPFKQLPFGMRGLSAPTLEALDRRGLLEELEGPERAQAAPSAQEPPPRRQAGHFAGIPFHFSHIDPSQWGQRLPGATDTHRMSEMAELESVLVRRAEALGVEIRRGLAVTDIDPTGDGVTVRCGELAFQGKWLVGCDGSRSVVRKAGGFEFAGTEPEFTGYSAQLDLADPEQLGPGRQLTSTGLYFQSQAGYLVMLEFDGGAAHRAEPATLEHVQEVLRRVSNTGVTIRALHAVTTWTDRARQATSYRNGRVLLAGDAAHIHAPLGGQGLNLGLGDAMNLGWKLAATVRGEAPEGLLDSYFSERHPVGAQVLDWSRAQVAIMKPDPEARALNAIIRDLMDTRDGATYFAGRVWGIFTHYDLRSSGHPLAGRSVPNFEFEDGARMGGLMHDGLGILLDFEGDASLQTWAAGYGGRIRYLTGRVKEAMGLSAVLIRPDGTIAWAADREPDGSELQEAAAHWFKTKSI